MLTPKVRHALLLICSCALLVAGLAVGFRHWEIQRAITTIERCGGGISDDEAFLYTSGPVFVTFNIPGNPVVPTDADAEQICHALTKFRQLKRVDFTGTALSDTFFVELSRQCQIDMIQIRRTRCGDRGVQALAKNGATQELYLEGLTLSNDTLSLLDQQRIRYVR